MTDLNDDRRVAPTKMSRMPGWMHISVHQIEGGWWRCILSDDDRMVLAEGIASTDIRALGFAYRALGERLLRENQRP